MSLLNSMYTGLGGVATLVGLCYLLHVFSNYIIYADPEHLSFRFYLVGLLSLNIPFLSQSTGLLRRGLCHAMDLSPSLLELVTSASRYALMNMRFVWLTFSLTLVSLLVIYDRSLKTCRVPY